MGAQKRHTCQSDRPSRPRRVKKLSLTPDALIIGTSFSGRQDISNGWFPAVWRGALQPNASYYAKTPWKGAWFYGTTPVATTFLWLSFAFIRTPTGAPTIIYCSSYPSYLFVFPSEYVWPFSVVLSFLCPFSPYHPWLLLLVWLSSVTQFRALSKVPSIIES